MSMPGREGRMGRFLMLTGSGLSIIVFAVALIDHNRLHSNDLRAARELGEHVRARLDLDVESQVNAEGLSSASWLRGQSPDSFEAALRQSPQRALAVLDERILYDEAERARFKALRGPEGVPGGTQASGLSAPLQVTAAYEAGAVSIRWSVASETLETALNGAMKDLNQQVGHRVYRSTEGAEMELLATLGPEVTRFRDPDMTLAGGELSYQVWTVLLQNPLGSEPTLVRSESGELVTVHVPEHFRLELVSGDSEAVVIRMKVGPGSMPIAVHDVLLSPGDPVDAGGLSTGLILTSLEVIEEERLTTRTRLVFTSDASLVLDPETHTPRTSDTQVLMPQTRLVATLTAPSGAPRQLQLVLQ